MRESEIWVGFSWVPCLGDSRRAVTSVDWGSSLICRLDGGKMLPNLLRGCWQDSGLYEVWQITTLSSFLAKRSSLLRVATQKELERSQQDTVRTWHDLVSKTVSTTLAVFCGSASGRSPLCPHSEDRSHTRTCTPGVGVTGSQAR